MSGWVSIHRKILNNILWQDKPFSKGQAWVDLLLITNHKKGLLKVKNGLTVEIQRGECGYSEVALAERWGWSRGKVRRFIHYLKCEKMIQQKNTENRLIIVVCNYDQFQTTHQTIHQTVQQTDTNNNDNKDNNIEEEEESASEILKNWYGQEYRNVHLTDKEYQKLLAFTLSEKALSQLIEDLSKRIAEGKEKNWSQDTSNIHYARLRAYWDYRRKNPDKFREQSKKETDLEHSYNGFA